MSSRLLSALLGSTLASGCPAPEETHLDTASEVDASGSADASDAQPAPEASTGEPDPTGDAALEAAPGPPECGDGELDAGESCDLAGANDDEGECTTTCQLPTCGDGLVRADVEQCDEGPDNDDAGACTSQCALATCGDGLVRAGVEQCDLGPDNSDAYGGCTPACALGPRCGDQVLQPEYEECEPGDRGLDGVVCGPGCRHEARLVFITSAVFDGDLGGLDGADLECRLAAEAAGIAAWPRFRAWLSDDTGSPLTRFTQGPATVGVPYVLLNGARVADDLDDLLAAGPQRGIDVTETLEMLPTQRPTWTNTSFTGATHNPTDHCARWTSNDPARSARVGMASAPPDAVQTWKDKRLFTSWTTNGCASSWRLYCFEQ